MARAHDKVNPCYEKPNDMIQWLLDTAPKYGGTDLMALQATLMVLMDGALEGTAVVAVHALYDLAARPEYLGPLRDEVREVL